MAARINTPQQQKLYNAALFALAQKQYSLMNLLTGHVPKGTSDINKKQSDKGAPVVRVTDLEKAKGDEVTVDIVHDINKEPTMGDDRIEGRGDSLTFASDTVKIDQTRHMVDSGGRMTKQRTGIMLDPVAKEVLTGYYRRLEEERLLYHAAGARGTRYTEGNIVPLQTSKNFNKIMVNTIKAPTHGRQFFGGDASSIQTLDSADLFSLDVVDNISLAIDEQDNPLQHVSYKDDKAAQDDPFYVLFVSPRQWHDFYTSTTNKDWQGFMANAMKRKEHFNHALFKGECLMYRSILIRQNKRFVEFEAGSTVAVSNNDAASTETNQTVAVKTHRALLFGGQAIAQAWGNAGKKQGGRSHFSANTEKVDHGNSLEHSIAWMNGCKKLGFEDKRGYYQDHGIIVADTAVSA